jgi:hypothetical protein
MVGLSDGCEIELQIVHSLWYESMSEMVLGISGVLSHLVCRIVSGGLHCWSRIFPHLFVRELRESLMAAACLITIRLQAPLHC